MPVFSQFLPGQPVDMEEGILYITEVYKTSKHLCPCGCKSLIVLPLNCSMGWDYVREVVTQNATIVDNLVTLEPSIGNFQIPCKSHYYIVKNEIKWCEPPIKA